jgi:hypothetical protein
MTQMTQLETLKADLADDMRLLAEIQAQIASTQEPSPELLSRKGWLEESILNRSRMLRFVLTGDRRRVVG